MMKPTNCKYCGGRSKSSKNLFDNLVFEEVYVTFFLERKRTDNIRYSLFLVKTVFVP